MILAAFLFKSQVSCSFPPTPWELGEAHEKLMALGRLEKKTFILSSIHPSIHSIHSFAQQSFSRSGPRTNAEDAKKKRERILPQASDSVSISWHIDCQICLTEEPGRLSRRKEAVQPKHRRNNSTDRHLDRSGDDK
jgi:hypothetical protein